MRTFVFAAVAAMSLLLPGIASADEYVFTVPVRIVNAAGVNGGQIMCLVSFEEGGRAVNDQTNAYFDVVDGSFSENVIVRVNTVRPRSSQRQWSCTMRLFYAVAGGAFPTAVDTIPEWYRNRSGRTVVSLDMDASGGRLP
jgi:hypothetical protein